MSYPLMYNIPIMNENLISILDGFTKFIKKYDVTKTNTFFDTVDRDYWTGDEYLESIQEGHAGSPEAARSYCIKPIHYEGVDPNYAIEFNKLESSIMSELGVEFAALTQLYPDDGFISWHSNANASSYNFIFTWSENGDGWFKYVHPITKEIVVMKDSVGWSCKAGYYGRLDEPDKILYHAAVANCKRMTMSFMLRDNKAFWEDAIEHITNA